ncbi:MAG: response regulator transcription factor [Bacillota bacterium]|nr:response regulator transcription factor [Bacillota bacterium]
MERDPGSPGTRVLVVEDERKLAEMIADFLRAQGYACETAADGLTALDRFASGRAEPDFVILDLMLPGLDGLEVCRRIRSRSRVPILILTARGEEADRLLGLELGADDYMVKPFSLRELAARVRAILRRSRGEASASPGAEETAETVHAAGLLRIYPERYRAEVDGRELELTRTEFRILDLLAERPGRVWTRLQLLEAAFGAEYAGYERTVDTHISNLRRKLAAAGGDPRWIGTVHGVGYRLDLPGEPPAAASPPGGR